MGPLGVEGSFRRCCEITMKVLQDQMPTLMSVLQPFVYDPLVSWSRQSKSDTRERTDSQAMTNVQHIEQRLKGYVCMVISTSLILKLSHFYLILNLQYSKGENQWSNLNDTAVDGRRSQPLHIRSDRF